MPAGVPWSYAVRRLLQAIPALTAIVVITFGVIHVAPGDPAGAFAGEYATPETIASLNRQYGLDQPFLAQFAAYFGNVLRGDLGTSFAYGRPVTAIIGERLPATLLLAGVALLLSSITGILVGVAAARRPGGPLDIGASGFALLAYAIPGFWLAQLAILLLGLRFGLFPVLGMTDTRIQYEGFALVLDVAHHLTLPVLVLAASEVALMLRLTRTGVMQQMQAGYARTAEAKGLPVRSVLTRHAFPNAALPIVTVIGTRIGFLFSGALIVETIFSWPGVGLLLVNAANTGDRPMALGLVLIVAASVVLVNVVTDIIYACIDPRISYT